MESLDQFVAEVERLDAQAVQPRTVVLALAPLFEEAKGLAELGGVPLTLPS